jgi:hypothetical protein
MNEPRSDVRLWDLPHGERVDVIRSEVDRVASRLRRLDPAVLDRPAIGDWSIREVIAHLVTVPRFYADNIERGASGDTGQSGDRPAPGTGRGEVAAAGIRKGAARLAERLDDGAIDELQRAGHGLADALDAEESSLTYDCYHPGGILPANRFVVLYLKELGLHEWDMFEALEPPCRMSRWGVDAAIQAMEEEIASGSLRWVTDPDATDHITFRLVTAGDVAIERDLLVEPHRTRLVPVDPQRSIDSHLRLDAADFALGCSGRRDLVAVVAEGRGEGDPEAVAVLARRLTGM